MKNRYCRYPRAKILATEMSFSEIRLMKMSSLPDSVPNLEAFPMLDGSSAVNPLTMRN